MRSSKGTVIKIAGAYVAWVMGSGFATGQEILPSLAEKEPVLREKGKSITN